MRTLHQFCRRVLTTLPTKQIAESFDYNLLSWHVRTSLVDIYRGCTSSWRIFEKVKAKEWTVLSPNDAEQRPRISQMTFDFAADSNHNEASTRRATHSLISMRSCSGRCLHMIAAERITLSASRKASDYFLCQTCGTARWRNVLHSRDLRSYVDYQQQQLLPLWIRC